ncbi:hypothetical protein Tco_1536275, partial [Tanacetum coccineum]
MDTVYPSLIYTTYTLPNTPYLHLDQKDKFDYVLIPFNFADMALSLRDQRHQYLRFKGLEYLEGYIIDFEERLGKIYGRGVHRVHVFDFGGLTAVMAEGLSGRMLMEHRDAQGQSVFTSRAWRQLFEVRGPLVHELILDFFSTFRFVEAVLDLYTDMKSAGFRTYWAESARQILNKGDLSAYWRGISFEGNFLGTSPSYTAIRDSMLRLCYRLIACSIAERSQAPENVTVTDLFYLRGMDVDSAVPAPVHAPQPPPVAALVVRTMPQRMARLEEEVHEIRESLAKQREVMDAMAIDFSRFTVWASSGISQLLDASRATCT